MSEQLGLSTGGFWRQKHSHKNTDPEIGPRGRKAGREPKETDTKPRTPAETQGPCPDLKGFCIKALTVCRAMSEQLGLSTRGQR